MSARIGAVAVLVVLLFLMIMTAGEQSAAATQLNIKMMTNPSDPAFIFFGYLDKDPVT